MLEYKIIREGGQEIVITPIHGKALLSISQLNKGTAFTAEERQAFGLTGKLPFPVETLEKQVERAHLEYQSLHTSLSQNSYLNRLLNTNQVLFYKLVETHLEEMLPTIYTPVVGNAVQTFSRRFTIPRGLYITYDDRDRIEEILENRTNPEVDLVVVSDGEGVLGIGDQGIGGMEIPVAKLMVYTLAGGIDPNRTLPIMIDAGTNNQELLKDPLYVGCRHPRIHGEKYRELIEKFVTALKKKMPQVFLHWEDFGKINAYENLQTYRDVMCSFNDDIQGTGVVALAALLAALKKSHQQLKDQRIVILGAGSAGVGVANTIAEYMRHLGISDIDIKNCFYLLDSKGLMTDISTRASSYQLFYLRSRKEARAWGFKDTETITLLDVVSHAKPTVLIGASTVQGAFNENVIKTMPKHVKHPIIFPLSNPTDKSEAKPEDVVEWTHNQALIATGSPFPPVVYHQQPINISQCNNYFAFPGIGLGVIAAKAKRVTNNMLLAASKALSEFVPSDSPLLLPLTEQANAASREIAMAVVKMAIEEGVARVEKDTNVATLVDAHRWKPHYLPYRRN